MLRHNKLQSPLIIVPCEFKFNTYITVTLLNDDVHHSRPIIRQSDFPGIFFLWYITFNMVTTKHNKLEHTC